MKEPESLQQAILFFASMDNCIAYLSVRRWPDGKVICPNCGSESVSTFNSERKTWKCAVHHPKREFSVKVGTLFEESPIGLDKWLTATWMLANAKNGVSSWELHRALKVSQKTAWFMLHRIRMSLQGDTSYKFGGDDSGPVESDETFVGPNPYKMHKDRKAKLHERRGEQMRGDTYVGKTAVFGVLDRSLRQVRCKVIPNVKRETLQNEILDTIEYGSRVYTDAAVGYDQLGKTYVHEVVNHANEYVRGQVHTQCIDNFWSLLKRTLRGTYVAVEPFHLDRYLDEQMFRFNNRATRDNPLTDADRFDLAVRNIVGKRLTFAELTGKPH
jgi:transposase-like protein